MKSEKHVQIRHKCSELIQIANLIGHHSIINIPNQTTKLICILWIAEETLNIPLLSQWLELLENPFQFPNDTSLLDLDLNLSR